MLKELFTIATLPVAMALDCVVIPLTGGDRSLTADAVKSLKR